MKPTFDGRTTIDGLKVLPETPGVYFFLDEKDAILYIGKATVLRDRVRSYFSSDILETRGPKIAKMIGLVHTVRWKATDSVLEALLLETRLIKECQPPYNTDAKDDKSYNHVVITDELFPRVLLVRGRDLSEGKFIHPIRSMYGPFPHGTKLRIAMNIVRKMFPYRDACEPWSAKDESGRKKRGIERGGRRNPKACFHAQIGLCPGVCAGEMSARAYGGIIRNIERFFDGEKKAIIDALEREMMREAKRLHFERAAELKRTIFSLAHIHDVALLAGEPRSADRESRGVRIEGYDVAHLGGESSVGVMVVCRDEVPDKDEYRKFLLRGKHAGDDLSALEEILRRRLRHSEWVQPDVVVVDGGFLQLGVAERLCAEAGWDEVRLVGVVKNTKHQPERLIGDTTAIAEYRRAILLANAEAHRFAIGYHRKRRSGDFLKK